MCHDSDFLDGKISRVPCGLSKARPCGFWKNHPRCTPVFFQKALHNPVHGCNGRKKTGTLAPRAGLCLIKNSVYMKISISPEMKSRLQNAAANGSMVAENILSELGKNRDASEIIRGTYNYFTTKRVRSNYNTYHKIRIMFTACGKNLEHDNFPDKGNPSAPWFSENRADLDPSTFVGLFKNLPEYDSEDIKYFISAITLDSRVTIRICSGMKDFYEAYCENNYTITTDNGESTLHNSCMRTEEKARNAADFYRNFAGAKILVAKDKDSNILGRAIIWEGLRWHREYEADVDVSLMDRIYTSHIFVIDMMRDAAKKAGIIFRKKYNDFSHQREVVALNPIAELEEDGETSADLVLDVPVGQWHKRGVPYLDTFSNLAINGECLELSNYYTRSQIADCQSTSGYATRTAYVCPRCNRVHEDSLNKFCGQCMSEIYTETIFGKVLNGHPVIYKGEQYPSSLFKRGKPMPQLKRYLQIERLFNN